MDKFSFQVGEKFVFLAMQVHCELDETTEFTLPNGIWILGKFPVALEEEWKRWLSEIMMEKLEEANCVFLKKMDSKVAVILDGEHEALQTEIFRLYHMIQLFGVPDSDACSVLKGGVSGEGPVVRQFFQASKYYFSEKYGSRSISRSNLVRAGQIADTWKELAGSGNYRRFLAGLDILLKGLQQPSGQEREHHFVRALEALIIPPTGETMKKFTHRCQTFCVPGEVSKNVLAEGYLMRSDTEHIHDWQRALEKYPTEERESIALLRSRQMEVLACSGYIHILENPDSRMHFESDSSLESFWKKPDDERRAIWGTGINILDQKVLCVVNAEDL